MRYLLKSTVLELKLLARDPITVVFTLALPVIVLYVLGAVFGNTPNPRYYRGVGAMDFYVPAYIGITIASMGVIGLPVHLAGYRERGILKRFRASDVPIWSIIGGQLVVTVVAGAVGSLIVWLAGTATYHVAFPKAPILVLAAFLLAALCFGAIGVLLGTVLPGARAAQGAGIILWFVMMMVGGAGPPYEVLGRSLQVLGDAEPLRHVVILIQDPWLGFGWNTSEMLVAIAITAACAGLSYLLLKYPYWPLMFRGIIVGPRRRLSALR
ncbi:MAG TPA: ABC transporter permease [Candidatus Dormibacteraeota bacterium]|nr:ABC transporter permease [Candidatus Dormibacteraeota bacterium]